MATKKKVEIFEFHPDHLEVMDIREEEIQGVMTLPDSYERFLMMSKLSIDAATFTYGNTMLFCSGYYQLWPGVLECWLVPSKQVEEHKFTFCRLLKNYINNIIKDKKCHRFQTTTPNDETHHRWMEFIGFRKEGVMKQYTHTKQDYCMYARIT